MCWTRLCAGTGRLCLAVGELQVRLGQRLENINMVAMDLSRSVHLMTMLKLQPAAASVAYDC